MRLCALPGKLGHVCEKVPIGSMQKKPIARMGVKQRIVWGHLTL